MLAILKLSYCKGPSIYDVHTEGGRGSGSGGRMWTGGGGGQAPCGRPHRKLKLESTDIIMSSSHAKKLASFFTQISSLDGITSEKFFDDINVIHLLKTSHKSHF